VKTKLLMLLAALALASFGLAACGDDDDDDSSEPAATEQTEDTGEDTGGTGGGSTVELSADPDGNLAFEQTEAEATAGSVTVELTNDSSVPHDVQIEGPDGDLGGTETISDGDTAEVTVDLEAGDYTFYCSVPGHREAGMEGTLTVD
jgi:plastocyanin